MISVDVGDVKDRVLREVRNYLEEGKEPETVDIAREGNRLLVHWKAPDKETDPVNSHWKDKELTDYECEASKETWKELIKTELP